jgi:hypothetical protein
MSGKTSAAVKRAYRERHRERLAAERRVRRAILRGSRVRTTVAERFWGKVHKTESCWLWMANLGFGGRYGAFYVDGRMRPAHRLAYEWLVGSVPLGLELDHLCGTPRCVNPDHLEPVSHAENMRRGRQHQMTMARGNRCRNGHEGAMVRAGVSLVCRECRRDSDRRYRLRKRAVA